MKYASVPFEIWHKRLNRRPSNSKNRYGIHRSLLAAIVQHLLASSTVTLMTHANYLGKCFERTSI